MFYLKKVIPKNVRLKLEGQYILSPVRSYQLGVQDQIKIDKIMLILEKSDLKEYTTNLEYRKVV